MCSETEKDHKGDPFVSGDWAAFIPLEDFYKCLYCAFTFIGNVWLS